MSNGFVTAPLNNNGGIYALYTGDANQNGTVDIIDMSFADNDASAFAFGYLVSDCDEDGGADILDMSLMENNAGLFLIVARPY